MQPDGLTGTIMAVEGISDGWTLLNGPLGCKYYHGHIADRQFPRPGSMDPMTFCDRFFFGQPRVPCTFLEETDYIGGPSLKLREVLPSLGQKVVGPIVVVNSPGASLIGEDIEGLVSEMGLSDRCMVVEAPGFSRPACDCYDEAMVAILRWMAPRRSRPLERSVNILGASLLQRHWQGSIDELSRLLAPMGVAIHAAVGAGCSSERLRESPSASANVALCREYCGRQADWYLDEFGVRTISCRGGAPVGFDSSEELVIQVASELGLDPAPSLSSIDQARAKAYREISRFNTLTGLPKGSSFSVVADSSIALPLTRWMYGYLGMVPTAIELLAGGDAEYTSLLQEFLCDIGMPEVMDLPVRKEPSDFVFADGLTISIMKRGDLCRKGIEIALPAGQRVDLVPRTLFGVSGSLQIIEDVLNGFWEGDRDGA
jgi:nitrogenase molybdenum-iron protein alpha/beta subunit